MPTISTCGGCGRIFSSTALFDAHRLGHFSKPLYAADDEKRRKPIAYTRHTRRCMTLMELHAAGYQCERRVMTVFREGQARRIVCEVWYDPAARETMRETFHKEPEEATAPPVPVPAH